ncbi:hypothetical protein ACRRTK_023411 [Alexandromys fortis]
MILNQAGDTAVRLGSPVHYTVTFLRSLKPGFIYPVFNLVFLLAQIQISTCFSSNKMDS